MVFTENPLYLAIVLFSILGFIFIVLSLCIEYLNAIILRAYGWLEEN